jgi:hypothetical protein
MMIVGVSLFVRMVQVLFRPRRVHQRCPSCGLSEHESDAVYCKRCGTLFTSQRRAEPGDLPRNRIARRPPFPNRRSPKVRLVRKIQDLCEAVFHTPQHPRERHPRIGPVSHQGLDKLVWPRAGGRC